MVFFLFTRCVQLLVLLFAAATRHITVMMQLYYYYYSHSLYTKRYAQLYSY